MQALRICIKSRVRSPTQSCFPSQDQTLHYTASASNTATGSGKACASFKHTGTERACKETCGTSPPRAVRNLQQHLSNEQVQQGSQWAALSHACMEDQPHAWRDHLHMERPSEKGEDRATRQQGNKYWNIGHKHGKTSLCTRQKPFPSSSLIEQCPTAHPPVCPACSHLTAARSGRPCRSWAMTPPVEECTRHPGGSRLPRHPISPPTNFSCFWHLMRVSHQPRACILEADHTHPGASDNCFLWFDDKHFFNIEFIY
jgi:hypothetical protein